MSSTTRAPKWQEPLPEEVYTAIAQRYGSRALDVRWDGPVVLHVRRGEPYRVACRPPLDLRKICSDEPDEVAIHVLTLTAIPSDRYAIGICPECNRGHWGIYAR